MMKLRGIFGRRTPPGQGGGSVAFADRFTLVAADGGLCVLRVTVSPAGTLTDVPVALVLKHDRVSQRFEPIRSPVANGDEDEGRIAEFLVPEQLLEGARFTLEAGGRKLPLPKPLERQHGDEAADAPTIAEAYLFQQQRAGEKLTAKPTVEPISEPSQPAPAPAPVPVPVPQKRRAPAMPSRSFTRWLDTSSIDELAEMYDVALHEWRGCTRAGNHARAARWREIGHAALEEAAARPELDGPEDELPSRMLHPRRRRLRLQLVRACRDHH